MNANLKSAVSASYIAANCLREGGLLVITGNYLLLFTLQSPHPIRIVILVIYSFISIGSSAALKPTPGILGYGMSKAATHHLVKSLGDPTSNLPSGGKYNIL